MWWAAMPRWGRHPRLRHMVSPMATPMANEAAEPRAGARHRRRRRAALRKAQPARHRQAAVGCLTGDQHDKSWRKIVPPLACTASVTCFQPTIWLSLYRRGAPKIAVAAIHGDVGFGDMKPPLPSRNANPRSPAPAGSVGNGTLLDRGMLRMIR